MKLSIIVPMYNSSETIERLLQSIVDAELEDYEVIAVDDQSTDDTLDKVHKFDNKLNLIYCSTDNNKHTPANTKQTGLERITGDFFTFIDHDDWFNPLGLKTIYNLATSDPDVYMFQTQFKAISYKNGEVDFTSLDQVDVVWLHGKLFNRKCVTELEAFFDPDIKSMDDQFFVQYVRWNIFRTKQKLVVIDDLFTYNWTIYKEDSVSHQVNSVENYLPEFIYTNTFGLFDAYYKSEEIEFKTSCVNALLELFYCGFMNYNAWLSIYGKDSLPPVLLISLMGFKKRLLTECGVTEQDMIDYVYHLPESTLKHHYKQIDYCPLYYSFREFINLI